MAACCGNVEAGQSAFSTPEEACVAVTGVLTKLACRRYEARFLHDTRCALTEILGNAFKHGNKMDPRKNVLFCWHIEDDTVVFEVQDEGRGFDLDALPDPRLPVNIERPNGRGVFLARRSMETFDVRQSLVRMSRSRQWRPSPTDPT